jgi:acyl-CoA thioester hydrolase
MVTTKPITTEMLVELDARDLTPTGYIDTTAYLRWVQAVVVMHWERFAPETARQSTLWITVKHTISHHAPGSADDAIVASTRIKRLTGVRALFVTTLSGKDKRLVEVESTWVCLDNITKLPKALEPEVLCLFGSAEPVCGERRTQ